MTRKFEQLTETLVHRFFMVIPWIAIPYLVGFFIYATIEVIR